ncbi:MAG: glycosyltransferase family 9 protein, partial [Candidatus Kapaibacteriota bacterium]
MKILIIRLSSLGDVILSTFVVRVVQNAFPNSTVDFLVANEFADVFKFNPRISNLIVYDKSKSFLLHIYDTLSIRNPRNYDVIIDLQNNLRSWVYSLGKSASIFRFDKRRLYKLLTVIFKKRASTICPIPILYAGTLPDLKKYDDGLGLELWTTKDTSGYLPHNKNVHSNHFQRVAIAPGAKHFSKILPLEKFIALVDLLQTNFSA